MISHIAIFTLLVFDIMPKLAFNSNTFHSSTDSGQIPRIPAGIQEFRGIPGIPEDSGRNLQESNWNIQKISLFRLYVATK